MKIVHIGLTGSFNDGWNYQENNLIHYQKKKGYEVCLLTTPFINSKVGIGYEYFKSCEYVDRDGVKIYRLPLKYSWFNLKISKFRTYKNIENTLKTEKPDIIFVHGVQSLDIKKIVSYIKQNKNIKVFVDNHCDFSNSSKNFISKNILHKLIWRHMAQMIEPYTTKFYGVLPARVDFLINMYGLPKNKVELLVMGADDEKVEEASQTKIKANLREKHGIDKTDFLIITGGKIDEEKIQTLLLMEAVKKINRKNVKLIVFGSVVASLKSKVLKLADEKNIQYIGWVDSQESYEYFATADLVVFPGRHSVFWEQAVGQGAPMICKYWDGTTHVDLGGNVIFLEEDSSLEIKNVIEDLLNDPEKYKKMKSVAMEKGMSVFSYKDIAERSIRS